MSAAVLACAQASWGRASVRFDWRPACSVHETILSAVPCCLVLSSLSGWLAVCLSLLLRAIYSDGI